MIDVTNPVPPVTGAETWPAAESFALDLSAARRGGLHHLGAEALANAVAGAVAVIDPEGRIRFANRCFAELLGVAADLMTGQPIGTWLRPAAAADSAATDDTAPVTGRRADGSEFPAGLVLTPIRAAGGDLIVATVRDLTDRDRVAHAHRDVRDLTEQLRRAQKVGALGRLAGGVAHDFNNLLQVIGGYADALGADALDQPTRRRLLRTIRGATDRAASLTRQLLAFGRRQVLLPEVIDLNVTVRSMERMMSRVIGAPI